MENVLLYEETMCAYSFVQGKLSQILDPSYIVVDRTLRGRSTSSSLSSTRITSSVWNTTLPLSSTLSSSIKGSIGLRLIEGVSLDGESPTLEFISWSGRVPEVNEWTRLSTFGRSSNGTCSESFLTIALRGSSDRGDGRGELPDGGVGVKQASYAGGLELILSDEIFLCLHLASKCFCFRSIWLTSTLLCFSNRAIRRSNFRSSSLLYDKTLSDNSLYTGLNVFPFTSEAECDFFIFEILG